MEACAKPSFLRVDDSHDRRSNVPGKFPNWASGVPKIGGTPQGMFVKIRPETQTIRFWARGAKVREHKPSGGCTARWSGDLLAQLRYAARSFATFVAPRYQTSTAEKRRSIKPRYVSRAARQREHDLRRISWILTFTAFMHTEHSDELV